ncbi:MAG TPA: type IV pilus twitching motility protein PilT [Thermoanaerobaculia bacterium]|nr:type IV pilus twitching motility protein PilT [Thermoanaerobaculia bacterium]
MSPEINLFGHLAVHYKLVSRDQLAEATRRQEREGHVRPLGLVMVEMGLLTTQQMNRLLEIQKQVLEKQAAKAAAAATPAPPRAPAPDLSAPAGGRRVDPILGHAVAVGASDLHLRSGEPLLLRVNGELAPAGEAPLPAELLDAVAGELLDPAAREALEREGQVDFAWTLAGRARFRGNAYRHQGGLGIVLRAIPLAAPSLGELGLPNELAQLTNHHQGLVLITGPAGCGKSSTLAALVRLVNEERRDHVITIEDPIEYLHRSGRAVVNQRQVGRDTGSFARALKAALREDPDVIAIGELRDLETISLALTAAETGHLVLATLHTGSSVRTVDRVVGSFPPSQQPQIRTMLSESLRAVVSQRLLRRADGAGRVPALEILLGTRAVANLIRESKTFQIRSILQTGTAQGMGLLDASLAQLVRTGTVTREEALLHAEDPKAIPGGTA